MNFGISTQAGSAGRELNDGLHAFKRHCGARAVLRDSWSLALEPGARSGPAGRAP